MLKISKNQIVPGQKVIIDIDVSKKSFEFELANNIIKTQEKRGILINEIVK